MAVYKELLKELILEGRTNYDLVVKEMLIRAEIMKRDFTKRQLNILTIIYTYSFAYGKEEALIPKIMDFSLSGVGINKVKYELQALEEMDVIDWNRDKNLYRIKETIYWKVPYSSLYNDERTKELFFLNLKHAGVNVEPILEKLNKMGL